MSTLTDGPIRRSPTASSPDCIDDGVTVDYRDVINSMESAVLVVDSDLKIRFANLTYYMLFGTTHEATLGQQLFDTHEELWSLPNLKALLESVIRHDVLIKRVRLEQGFPIIGQRILMLSAQQILRGGVGLDRMAIVLRDVTSDQIANDRKDASLERTHAMVTEVHHRVKNNLATIRSMLRIEARGIEDQASRDLLDRIGRRVESMTSLYELLAINANTGDVQLLDYFRRLCRSIEAVSSGEHIGWSIEVTGEEVTVDTDEAINIGAVVNELVANAAKYAFTGRQDIGRITVGCFLKEAEIAITVADNGNGFDDSDVGPKSTGLGMRLVQIYLSGMGGRFDRQSSERGTVCSLRIPYARSRFRGMSATSLPAVGRDAEPIEVDAAR